MNEANVAERPVGTCHHGGKSNSALGTEFGLLRLPRTFRRAEKVVARPPPTEESNLNTPSTRQRPAG